MKILWIEDFGGKLARSLMAAKIFKELLPDINLAEVLKPGRTDFASQISDLFRKHSLHEVFLCQSYVEWKQLYENQGPDFNIALIDINLSGTFRTPVDQLPEGADNRHFDKMAGLYIYHQLIKDGHSSDDIAFFTGESETLEGFLRSCDEILLDRPKHIFEKDPHQFKALRDWLGQRAFQKMSKGIRILLVDDEAEILGALASVLQAHGYEVATAKNGQQALTLARANEFDIVITDLSMPLMSGLEFIEYLPKRNPPTRTIVISGHETVGDALRALKLNVFAWIQKGKTSSVKELLESIEKATWEKTKTERNRKLRVFLCHASEDKEAVRRLYRNLSTAGFDPWIDREKLLPGQEWQQEILTAVESTDVVIICLSRQSINKEGYVQKEVRCALELADQKPPGTLFLIPLRLEECELPSYLRRWHSADIFEQENGVEKLLSALRLRASSLGLLES